MKRSEKVFLNSSISFISQICSLLFTFATRKVFLWTLGVELLGITNTFLSVLNTLSLAELGFETAVVYNLYEPLNRGDTKRISAIISVYKRIYMFVAIFILIVSIICLPILKYILNGIKITSIIYLYFLLQAANSIVSYLLAYKRTLIYADQKEYICQVIDLICNVCCSLLRILVLIFFKSFILYLLSQILQTFLSNILIYIRCKKMYPFLNLKKFDINIFKEMFESVKQVFASKIAYFINNSTDNIVISMMISTVTVGYFTNYTTITSTIKRLVLSIMRPISPIIGGMLSEQEIDGKKKESIFFLYTHMGYILALIVIIPTMILLNDFIAFIYGIPYILQNYVVILIAMDLYVNFVHRVCCDYINGAGLFKYDKYIEFLGAFINIVISVLLASKFGIFGVLLGTVLSSVVFWVGRSFVACKYCLDMELYNYLLYWVKNIYSLIAFFIIYIITKEIYVKFLLIDSFVVRFLISGIITEFIIISLYMILFILFKEQKKILSIIKTIINVRITKSKNQ